MNILHLSRYATESAELLQFHLKHLAETAPTRTSREAADIACPKGRKRPNWLHACRPVTSAMVMDNLVYYCPCGAYMFQVARVWTGRNGIRYPRLVAWRRNNRF